MTYAEFKKEFNLDNSADRLDYRWFVGIDFDLLAKKMRESETCLMQKNSSLYIIKNYGRIIKDEMKDFSRINLKPFIQRAYEKSFFDSLIDEVESLEF